MNIGRITDDVYTRKKQNFTDEIKRLEKKIEQISKADEEYYILADTILSLSQRAGELFESSELQQKKEILNLTLQNLTLTGEKLSYDLIKPFDIILKSNDNHIWLPVYDIFLNLKFEVSSDLKRANSLLNFNV